MTMTMLNKYEFSYSGTADVKTANYANDNIRARSRHQALTRLAMQAWKCCGWSSYKDCKAHIFDNFGASKI